MKRVIEADILFDGENLVEGASILIDGQRIEAIGQKGDFKNSSNEIISTKFLMPGLIDMHLHITGYKEAGPEGAPFEPMKKFLKLLLYNSITTVRDVGNYLETIMYLKRWVKKYPGPIIYSSGPLLDKPPIIWPSTRVITSSQEAKLEVEKLSKEEVDLIKVYRNIPPDILEVVIVEAHKRGLKVAGDISASRPLEAARLKIDSIEHVINLIDEAFLEDSDKDFLPKEDSIMKKVAMWSKINFNHKKIKLLIELLVSNDIYICPTLLVIKRKLFPEEMFEEPYLDYMIPIMPYHKYFKYMQNPIGKIFGLKYMKRYFPGMNLNLDKNIIKEGFLKMLEFVKILSENGAKIIIGTDAPNPSIVPGFSLHQEMQLLKQAGLTSREILSSSTYLSAKLLGNNEIGRIKPNMLANLILIDGNPVKEINDISKISYIFLRGELYKREAIMNSWVTKESK